MDKKHLEEIDRCSKFKKDSKKCIAENCYYYFPIKNCGVNYIKQLSNKRKSNYENIIKRSKKKKIFFKKIFKKK